MTKSVARIRTEATFVVDVLSRYADDSGASESLAEVLVFHNHVGPDDAGCCCNGGQRIARARGSRDVLHSYELGTLNPKP